MGDGSILRDISLMFERAIYWAFQDVEAAEAMAALWCDRAEELIRLRKEL